jgi:hypothetical protein
MNTAAAIAHILNIEAERVGRGWSMQGIFAAATGALDEDGRTPAQVVLAGLAAIADKTAKTPGAIRWPARYVGLANGPAVPQGPRCAVCGRSIEVHDAAEAKLPEALRHAFEEGR